MRGTWAWKKKPRLRNIDTETSHIDDEDKCKAQSHAIIPRSETHAIHLPSPCQLCSPAELQILAAAYMKLAIAAASTHGGVPEAFLPLMSPIRAQLEPLGHLGRGGFGQVVLYRSRLDQRLTAVKQVKFRSPLAPWAAPEDLAQHHHKLLREVTALASLASSPFVVRYHSSWIEPDWAKLGKKMAAAEASWKQQQQQQRQQQYKCPRSHRARPGRRRGQSSSSHIGACSEGTRESSDSSSSSSSSGSSSSSRIVSNSGSGRSSNAGRVVSASGDSSSSCTQQQLQLHSVTQNSAFTFEEDGDGSHSQAKHVAHVLFPDCSIPEQQQQHRQHESILMVEQQGEGIPVLATQSTCMESIQTRIPLSPIQDAGSSMRSVKGRSDQHFRSSSYSSSSTGRSKSDGEWSSSGLKGSAARCSSRHSGSRRQQGRGLHGEERNGFAKQQQRRVSSQERQQREFALPFGNAEDKGCFEGNASSVGLKRWPYTLYISMDAVPGVTLDVWLAHRNAALSASAPQPQAPCPAHSSSSGNVAGHNNSLGAEHQCKASGRNANAKDRSDRCSSSSSSSSSSSRSSRSGEASCEGTVALGPLEQSIFAQIVKGLSHVHGQGLVHRDLKPSNIFVVPIPASPGSGASGGLPGMQVLLGDFGLSSISGMLNRSSSSSSGGGSSSSNGNISNMWGRHMDAHKGGGAAGNGNTGSCAQGGKGCKGIGVVLDGIREPEDLGAAGNSSEVGRVGGSRRPGRREVAGKEMEWVVRQGEMSLGRASSFHTRTTQIGTPSYCAPEQLAGKEASAQYGPEVDVYPLGLILMELACPFSTGMERAVAMQHAQPAKGANSPGSSGSPRSPVLPTVMQRKLPGESALALRLLSTRPRQRPTSSQVLTALAALWGIEEVHAIGPQLHETHPGPALVHRRSLPAATPLDGPAPEMPGELPPVQAVRPPPRRPALPAAPLEKPATLLTVQQSAAPSAISPVPPATQPTVHTADPPAISLVLPKVMLEAQPVAPPVIQEGGQRNSRVGTLQQLVDVGVQTDVVEVSSLQDVQDKDKELKELRERVAYLEKLLQKQAHA